MKNASSYFEQLKYDPKLSNTGVYKYITNVRFVSLLIISILLVGIFSYLSLPRRSSPEVKIPVILVSTALPGAGPDDVESLVTIPLEDVTLIQKPEIKKSQINKFIQEMVYKNITQDRERIKDSDKKKFIDSLLKSNILDSIDIIEEYSRLLNKKKEIGRLFKKIAERVEDGLYYK